jgi:LuxR family maltose regulon positive regulatory protein
VEASTVSPILETKLLPAAGRPASVPRARLLDELDAVPPGGLTVVVAPVGFGKTTLVRGWCERTDAAVAWLSLDEADDDPTRLWTYLAASLDRIRSGLGRPALRQLRTAGASVDAAADEVLNAVTTLDVPVAIVLDDLHLIRDEACLRSLGRAAERLPPDARMILTTRSDPAFPLARLRARGHLHEVRASGLAFTFQEAQDLLVKRERIPLDDTSVGLLVERTEGWPAGLYLAALWLRALDDPAAGVRAFQADHRHVADYLTGEVLDLLDDETRDFMLRTSALRVFNAELCDDVLDRVDSAERLRELAQSNGFLIPLDARGGWHRWHHLFGELLELELGAAEPGAPAALHAAAASWCLSNDRIEEALEHAAAASDQELVAHVLWRAQRELLTTGRLATVIRWCRSLPEAVLLDHPDLPLGGALAAGLSEQPPHLRRRFITLAQQSRAQRPDLWTDRLEGALGMVSALLVQKSVRATVAVSRDSLDAARTAPDIALGAIALLSFLLYLDGEDEDSRAHAQEAVDRPDAAERPHGIVVALATLALAEVGDGRPESAEALAREALADARTHGIDASSSAGIARTALAAALAAQGSLTAAAQEAALGERLCRQPEAEARHLHALLVLADIEASREQVARARTLLAQATDGLATFDDAGRLPGLVAAVEQRLAGVSTPALPEEPTAAESAVLRLLGSDLSLREIGSELFLSRNTVKSHTRSLYRKLGVTSRAEAVQRAAALGLITPAD